MLCLDLFFQIPGVTTHLLAKGIYTVDYFVLFCTRYGSVYKLMRDKINIECLVSLPTLPVDLAFDFNRFLAINMDSTFESYTLKVLVLELKFIIST